MIEFISNLFHTDSWPARWSCGKWTSFHGCLYIMSDVAIWAAYFAIPIILFLYISRNKHKLPFQNVLVLFMLFILLCGFSHLVDAIMFWYPFYRLSAIVLFFTAVVSWITVVVLIKSLPYIFNLKSAVQLEEIILDRTSELEESNKYQKKLNNDLDHFVYSASHDLKSPISNIEGLFALLKLDLERQQALSPNSIVLERIEDSIFRVNKTIASLADILKVQRNPYEDVDIVFFEELVSEIICENEEFIKTSNVLIIKDFELASVNFSRHGLKSIIYNLVINSVKYRSNERASFVKIKTFTENGKEVLTVEDNGLGMNLPRDIEKVFSIFKRMHDHVEGSGIGLYIIKCLIEDKGGTIDVSSQVDQGSIFKVVF